MARASPRRMGRHRQALPVRGLHGPAHRDDPDRDEGGPPRTTHGLIRTLTPHGVAQLHHSAGRHRRPVAVARRLRRTERAVSTIL